MTEDIDGKLFQTFDLVVTLIMLESILNFKSVHLHVTIINPTKLYPLVPEIAY